MLSCPSVLHLSQGLSGRKIGVTVGVPLQRADKGKQAAKQGRSGQSHPSEMLARCEAKPTLHLLQGGTQSPCTHSRLAEHWAVFQRPGGERERHCPVQAPLTPQVQQGEF